MQIWCLASALWPISGLLHHLTDADNKPFCTCDKELINLLIYSLAQQDRGHIDCQNSYLLALTYLRPDTSFVRYSRLHASTDLCVHEQGSWKHLTHENAEILGPTAHAQREGTQSERTEARL